MNPILQKLNNQQGNGINNLIQMARGNPQAVFDQMVKTNPQFSQFVRENQGKRPEQIAQEHGINPAVLQQFTR